MTNLDAKVTTRFTNPVDHFESMHTSLIRNTGNATVSPPVTDSQVTNRRPSKNYGRFSI